MTDNTLQEREAFEAWVNTGLLPMEEIAPSVIGFAWQAWNTRARLGKGEVERETADWCAHLAAQAKPVEVEEVLQWPKTPNDSSAMITKPAMDWWWLEHKLAQKRAVIRDLESRLKTALTAWNTRAQPRYILRMNGSEVQKELDALTTQPAPAALPAPSINEDKAVEIMLKHMKAEWLNDTTGWLIPAREAYRALLASGVIRTTPNQSPAAACDDTQSYKKAYEILRDAMQFCRPEHVTREALSHAEAAIASPDIEKE